MRCARLITPPLLALAALSAGCAALSDKWTDTVHEVGDRGPRPVQYAGVIKAYFDQTLKDPFSAIYKPATEPVEGFASSTRVVQSPTLINVNGRTETTKRLGWVITVDVNAKNSYGGYTGWTTYAFLFQGESLLKAGDRSSGSTVQVAR